MPWSKLVSSSDWPSICHISWLKSMHVVIRFGGKWGCWTMIFLPTWTLPSSSFNQKNKDLHTKLCMAFLPGVDGLLSSSDWDGGKSSVNTEKKRITINVYLFWKYKKLTGQIHNLVKCLILFVQQKKHSILPMGLPYKIILRNTLNDTNILSWKGFQNCCIIILFDTVTQNLLE